jgi:hypothetical protein
MKVERILLVIFILFVIPFSGFQCGKGPTVPDNLIGVWETTDPMYADRTFEITRNEVIFQTGEQTFNPYTIKKIEMEKAPGKQTLLYTFHYMNQKGLQYKFSFYYDPAGQGEIRYKNQSQILWTKRRA